jgi:hypothetical protein
MRGMQTKRFWRNRDKAVRFAIKHSVKIDDIGHDNMGYFVEWMPEDDKFTRGKRR